MKIIKQIATFVLALCLTVPGFSLTAEAAGGRVSFTDPETKTGESVEVVCALRADSGSLESFEVTLKYDPEFLAFESGDEGVQKDSDGVISFSGKGEGTNRIGFAMKFQALKEGTTKVEVSEASGFTTGGDSVDCKSGNSTVKIAQGTEPVTVPTDESSVKVTVGEQEYSLSGAFKASDIPAGFTEGTLSYDGGEHKIVQNETTGIKLGYLVDQTGKGAFFLYNEENATFSPYVSVVVSPTTSIALLKADSSLKVPDGYQEVKLTVNEHEFPAWQDSRNEGFYLVYAMGTDGSKGFYQYDTEQESYQRFVGQNAGTTVKKPTAGSKVSGLLEGGNSTLMLGGGAALIVLIIIVIVLAVKLHRSNQELDDLYDELDGRSDDDDFENEDEDGVIRLDEEQKQEKRRQFRKQPKKQEVKEDFDDYYEDDEEYDEADDFDEDFGEEFGDDFDEDFGDDFDQDFNGDFDLDFDSKVEKPKKKAEEEFDFGADDFGMESLDEDDFNVDDFEVDFIDLD